MINNDKMVPRWPYYPTFKKANPSLKFLPSRLISVLIRALNVFTLFNNCPSGVSGSIVVRNCPSGPSGTLLPLSSSSSSSSSSYSYSISEIAETNSLSSNSVASLGSLSSINRISLTTNSLYRDHQAKICFFLALGELFSSQ